MVNAQNRNPFSDAAHAIPALIAGYEARIAELEKENADLRTIALIQSEHVTELIAKIDGQSKTTRQEDLPDQTAM